MGCRVTDSSLVTYTYWAPAHGGGQNPNIAVIHDIECPLVPGYARTLTGPAYFGGSRAGVSAHYVVDPVDTCQGVREGTVGYHVGGSNEGKIGVEQAGYARFTTAQWKTPDAVRQHARVAALLADINRRRPLIRLRILTDSELRTADRNPGSPGGITTHNQISRVLRTTSHHDPYVSSSSKVYYPLGEVVNAAIRIRGGGTVTPPPTISAEDPDMAQLISSEGTIYQFSGGHFRRVGSPRELAEGQKYGALVGPVRAVSWDEANRIRAWALRPDTAMQPRKPVVSTTQKYTVRAGDGFDAIAAKFGTDRAGLQKLNPQVKSVDRINIGDVLTVPKR